MLWNGNECGKNKTMRISIQPFPVKLVIDQKQLENVKSFKYLGSMLTNDGRCTCEIKSRIAMAKAALTRRGLFLLAKWIGTEEETIKILHLEYSFIWC
jgi:hypothetical protein